MLQLILLEKVEMLTKIIADQTKTKQNNTATTKRMGAWGHGSAAKLLFSMCQALGSSPNTIKFNKERQRWGEGKGEGAVQ